MTEIHSVVLELVRPGPAHNQLLSPLTPYVALCGDDSPVTVNLPFEHRQLLMRLARLSYRTDNLERASEDQLAQRQGELRDIGESLGRVLGQVPALLAELSRIGCDHNRVMHLRLSLAASELGMVPFETAIAPAGFPGSGSPLFLQTRTPICVTRETRRGHPLPLDWTREPRVLFVFASPAGLVPVPYREHLSALREALRPWIRTKTTLGDQVAEVRKSLVVLPNASLQEIRDLCSRESFTHVHILAHGVALAESGDMHFGLALCGHGDRSRRVDVSGASLALALLGKSDAHERVSPPHLVSLAACDSGNLGSVLAPGGSIAHDLHAAGIPWVIASQFPLWISASSILVQDLYRGLLEGEDPRQVLYGTRQRLRTDCPGTHDWASVVAYAAIPADFDRQVRDFRDAQIRRRTEVLLDHLDELIRGLADWTRGSDVLPDAGPVPEKRLQQIELDLEATAATLLDCLTDWCEEARQVGASTLWNRVLAERLGLAAACEKRVAIAWATLAARSEGDDALSEQRRQRSHDAYRASRDRYGDALSNDPVSTWLMTQYLSVRALPDLGTPAAEPLDIAPSAWFQTARRLSEAEANRGEGRDRGYALGTQIELCLLQCVYDPGAGEQKPEALREYLLPLRSQAQRDRIPLIATRRQLERYAYHWRDSRWSALAKEAHRLLAEGL